MIGTVIVVGFVLIALLVAMSNIFGVQITPYNPITQDVGPAACATFVCPSVRHGCRRARRVQSHYSGDT